MSTASSDSSHGTPPPELVDSSSDDVPAQPPHVVDTSSDSSSDGEDFDLAKIIAKWPIPLPDGDLHTTTVQTDEVLRTKRLGIFWPAASFTMRFHREIPVRLLRTITTTDGTASGIVLPPHHGMEDECFPVSLVDTEGQSSSDSAYPMYDDGHGVHGATGGPGWWVAW